MVLKSVGMAEILVVVGLLLGAVALYLWFGWAAVLAFVGAAAIVSGLLLAYFESLKRAKA